MKKKTQIQRARDWLDRKQAPSGAVRAWGIASWNAGYRAARSEFTRCQVHKCKVVKLCVDCIVDRAKAEAR